MTDTFTPSLRTIALVGDPRSSASVELVNGSIGELPVATAMQADPTDTVGTAAQGHGNFGLVMPIDTAQSEAPTTANLQGDTVSYTEQLGQRLLDAGSNATIADVDSANFNGGSLRIQITAGLQAGVDFIFFVGNGRVSLSSQSAGATVFVQLAGDAGPVAIGILANDNLFQNNTVINFNSDNATPARVQELLRSITYNGNSDTLISGQRTITYTLNDGDGGVSTTTSFVDVTAVNDLPVVNAGTGQASFSEGVNVASTPVAVAPVLTLTDPDNTTFASATATISANREASDLLAFINTNSTTFGNITASYDGATGVLTLTSAGATATRAQFQAALRAVTFTSTSEEPSTATRTVSFVVNDGTDNSVASTRQVLVQANNDAPSGTSQTLIINEDQVRTLSASDFGFTDVDGDAFAGVRFSAAPTGGTLFFDADGAGAGAPVAVTTFPTGTYTAAQLAAGQLTFVPAANLNGAAAASISFAVVDDGGTTGAGQNTDPTPNTLTFDIASVNDAPVVTTSPGSAAFVEGANVASTPVVVDPDLIVTDIDSPTLASATVTITNWQNFNLERLALSATDGIGNITASYTAVSGQLTLTSAGNTATLAEWQAALRSVTYVYNSDTPVTIDRIIAFQVNDGSANSATATRTVTVTAVNDAPTITGFQGDVVNFTEDGLGSVWLDSGRNNNVGDPDSANFDGGQLRIRVSSANGSLDDLFSVFANGSLGVSGNTVTFNGTAFGTISYEGATLVISFNANGTQQAARELIRSITYENTNNYNPAPGARTVELSLSDGDGGTTVQTSTINVITQNDAPRVQTNAGATVDEGATIVLTPAMLRFIDDESADGAITYTIGSAVTNGVLYRDGVALANGATFTQADIAAGLISYVHDGSETLGATFSFVVSDGQGLSSPAESFVFAVTPVNDAPSSTGFDNITYTEGDGVRNLDVGFNQVLTDPDSANFDGGTLTVSITGNKVATEDQLTFTTGGTSFLSASGGVLSYHGVEIATYTAGGVGLDRVFTFNANATLEAVQTVMRNIAYINTNQANPSTDQRTVSYTLTDGDGGTLNLTSTIDVVGVNDAPVVDLNGADPGADNSASYTEQAPVITLAGDIVLSDVDSATLTGATVRVTGGFVPLAGDGADYLGINGSGAGAINGIAYSYSASTGILTLSGAATVAAYQAVLAQVTFQSTTNNPGTSRTISWTVTDGAATSAAATTTITVTPVNDPVSSTLPGGTQSGTEDSDLIFSTATGNAIRVADPDQEPITVTLSVANGVLTLSGIAGLSFTTGTGSGDSTMTFTGTPAAINAALNGLRYRGDLNFSGADTLAVDVTDGLTNSSGSIAISLAPDDVIDGDPGNNSLDGTTQNDFFDLSQGGDDNLRGYEGDDGFYFGGAYDVNDVIDGGAGARDQIGLQGNYSAGVTLGSLIDVELVVLLAGNDARFGGQTGTDLNYNIVADGNTIVSDNKLIVQANQLRAGESLTFDGSASAIDFIVYGGFGTDILTGGSGNDGFFFGQGRFGVNDIVDGGAGNMDQLGLQGDYTGAGAVTFGANQLSGIELIALLSAGDNRFGASGGTVSYDLTMHDDNVAAGQTMAISANTLQIGEDLSFDGSAETDGRFEIYSGAGNDVIFGGAGDDLIFGGGGSDTLYGGAGNDIFAYRSVTDSNSDGRDGIQDFFLGDRIDLSRIDANTSLGGNQDFSFVGTAAFTGTAGELRYENISSGGPIYLVQGDVNGDGVSDLEIVLVMTDRNELTVGDFIGVNAAAQGAVPLLTEVKADAPDIGLRADDVAAPDLAFIGPDHDLALSHMTGDLLL